MKKVIIFLLNIIFLSNVYSQQGGCDVIMKNIVVSKNIFTCDIKIQAYQGWKIAKFPIICVKKSQNMANIKFNQKTESANTCVATLSANVVDLGKNNGKIFAKIECPICKNICTIINKKIIMSFDRKQRTAKLDILDNSKEWPTDINEKGFCPNEPGGATTI